MSQGEFAIVMDEMEPTLIELVQLVQSGRVLSRAEKYFLHHMKSLAPNPIRNRREQYFYDQLIPAIDKLLG